MLDLVYWVLLAIALGVGVLIGVLVGECIAAFFPVRNPLQDYDRSFQPQVAVLMPAHNEAAGIKATLKSILPQLGEQDRLVVIADNCSDDTAAIARNLGATVLERENLAQKGKGYALDYGLRFLAQAPPDVVVMVDADCTVSPGCIEQLSHLAATQNRPVQALYLMEQPINPSAKDSISALAFLVKNFVRPLGLNNLQLPCLLTGTGMAFPWSTLHHVSLASGNIVEDMQLGLDLAIAGYAPLFCPPAKVTGQLPQQATAAKSQRTRWEHGHLQTLIAQVPRLLKASLQHRRLELSAIALEVAVPPLSLLVLLWLGSITGAILLGSLGKIWLPTLLLSAEGLLLLLAIFAAWAKFGREHIPLKSLLAIPFYILWKLPLYFAFLLRPQKDWVRTERDV